jgi:hypothetical protein
LVRKVSAACRESQAAGSKRVRDQPFREALGDNVLHLLPYEFIAPVSTLTVTSGHEA